MKPISERDRLRRSTQPIILKWWKLQISHDHTTEDHNGNGVVNVYWALRHLFSLSGGRLNIPKRIRGKLISIPLYKQ